MDELLRAEGISKSFGGALAIDGVSVVIRRGVVHGFVGANGAGKSTLIKCMAGVVASDAGHFIVDGVRLDIDNPDVARRAGLAFIHQEMSLIEPWDVLRNLGLGLPYARRVGFIDWRPMRRRAHEVKERLGIDFSLGTRVQELSAAQRALVMIGRALMQDARLIAMDEPTAALSHTEAQRLHRIIQELANDGTAVIFVSHRLEEVSLLCRDVTVFRDGRVVNTMQDQNFTRAELVQGIVGHAIEEHHEGASSPTDAPIVLRLDGIADRSTLKGVSLQVHAGEVVGLGGLVGAGRSEVAHIVFGDTKPVSGEMYLKGRPWQPKSPAHAIRAGVALIPEERRAQALFPKKSIIFNINVANFARTRFARHLPFLSAKAAEVIASIGAREVAVNTSDMARAVDTLSGGNQQKVVIARWLQRKPDLLILDEPTRGVDVGARAQVHKIIRDLAGAGMSVLAISSDNEELTELCDRVVVLAGGRVTGELSAPNINTDRLLHLSFEHKEGAIEP